jgi:hypothetical protein
MPDTPTPGQLCYEAYWRSNAPKISAAMTAQIWYALSSRTHEAWEAAAQAVLAWKKEEESDA